MMTPQEAREKANFEKAVFGGYSTASVDEYVAELLGDYSAACKEANVLRSKMKVLVDRLEEYRQREESMNKVMLAAQKTADDMVADAERKCARMLSETEENLRQRSRELQHELDSETLRVAEAKKAAAEYITKLEADLHRCLEELAAIRQMAAPAPEETAPSLSGYQLFQEPEEVIPATRRDQSQVSREINETLNRMLEEEQDKLQESMGDTRVIPIIE